MRGSSQAGAVCTARARAQARAHLPPSDTYHARTHTHTHNSCSLFVHKFSRPYMPIFNLFKNCGYYWGFAVLVGYPLVHPSYTAPGVTQVALGGALWCASQLTNLAVHCQLAGMRGGDGDDAREPPQGLLFSLVTSPNYTSEVLAWLGWSLLCNVAMGYLFAVGGFVQMLSWALQKYNGYKKDKKGKEYTKSRKAIVPFVI